MWAAEVREQAPRIIDKSMHYRQLLTVLCTGKSTTLVFRKRRWNPILTTSSTCTYISVSVHVSAVLTKYPIGPRCGGASPSRLDHNSIHFHSLLHQLWPCGRLLRYCLISSRCCHLFIHHLHLDTAVAALLRQTNTSRTLLARRLGSCY